MVAGWQAGVVLGKQLRATFQSTGSRERQRERDTGPSMGF